MTDSSLSRRIAYLESVARERQRQKEVQQAGLLPFKIIRYGPAGEILYETSEEKMKPLAPGEVRKVLHIRDDELADFHRELKRKAGIA